MKYDNKYGNYLGQTRLFYGNRSLLAVLIKPLQTLGPKNGDTVDVYHFETDDGRWGVTYIQSTPEQPLVKPPQKTKAAACT